jgi:L-serine dehydratase
MKSLRELYRIGQGPSSSHTMGPRAAARRFLRHHPKAANIRVTLHGSLAATGKGHLTDLALRQAIIDRPLEILWRPGEELPEHTNGMVFEAFDGDGRLIGDAREYSIGGGALLSDSGYGERYRELDLRAVLRRVEKEFGNFWAYVFTAEDEEFPAYLEEVWRAMCASVERGLDETGPLPGALHLMRKSREFLDASTGGGAKFRECALVSAYAYAVSEENASGGMIVTAPTCGASGILPAVLYFLQNEQPRKPTRAIVQALATAGLFGNVIKHNASISGAYVGCQGEVGAACAMAAAAFAQLLGGTPRQIEYAAEMGLEHHLGLTCDPVLGLVQIPCIERNVHAALRAIDCAHLALLSDGEHRISFDDTVSVLLETGEAMSRNFKETSLGGLARIYHRRFAGKGEKKEVG